MAVTFPPPPGRRLGPVCAALLVVALAGCAENEGPSATTAPSTSPPAVSDGPAPTATGAAATPSAGPAPSGNDVAPYDATSTRDAAGSFGTAQRLDGSLEAVVEGPRPATTGERPVRAAPGTPVQVFTLTLTNTGSTPVDAVPWSFPVAVAGAEPAVPVFDESLGVPMETFPTIAPGESASLEVAFAAAHDAELAVRVFATTTPDHYVEFTD
ncbi:MULTISPECIES: hypothetical protein [Kocuria]|uniref:DUF4352 domain-containing protein n=1 Tax=Kocuria rosea subsp. polaris TaxID=136273 RepID=A0A0W8IA55_KOCRO|nr:hypothetical protein [Kocuria polaris]KUG56520.1 hypothetical protein AVL61_05500 [Kocuria polaris]